MAMRCCSIGTNLSQFASVETNLHLSRVLVSSLFCMLGRMAAIRVRHERHGGEGSSNPEEQVGERELHIIQQLETRYTV
jgi:hypothetical protein